MEMIERLDAIAYPPEWNSFITLPVHVKQESPNLLSTQYFLINESNNSLSENRVVFTPGSSSEVH